MNTKHKILPILLAVCMLVSLLPTTVFAESESRTPVQIEVRNSQNGNTEYKINDGEWIGLNGCNGPQNIDGVKNGDSVSVRAIPNRDQELDSWGTQFWINGDQQALDTNALLSDKGWSFTYNDGDTYDVQVEYRGEGNNPGPQPQGNPGEFCFNCMSQMVIGGSIYYKLDNAAEFIKVDDTDNQYHSINVAEANSVTMKLVPNEGYQLDTVRGVRLWVNGNNKYESNGEYVTAFTSEDGYTFDLNSMMDETEEGKQTVAQSNFELEFGFGNANSEDPGPAPQPEGNTEATINYSFKGEVADIRLNHDWWTEFDWNGAEPKENVTYTDTVCYGADEEANTVEISVGVFFITTLTRLEINGVDYSNRIPKTQEDLMAAFTHQHTYTTVEIPKAEDGIYTIYTESRDAEEGEVGVGNFLWSYDENDRWLRDPNGNPQQDENGSFIPNDDFIDHGRLELVGLTYNGVTYTKENLDDIIEPDTAVDWDEPQPGDNMDYIGGGTMPAGALLTVRLIPEYGYQLSSFGVNGGQFTAEDDQSVFTFEVAPGNFHLAAHFAKVEDAVRSTAEAVCGGSIAIADNEINTGSVILSVNDANLSDAEKAAFTRVGDGNYTVSDYMDITLDQVVYKGSRDDMWSNSLGKDDELKSPATVTLTLADGVDGQNLVVLHQKHDGTYEVIPTTYDPANHTITFSTSSFSNYALATAAHSHNLTKTDAKAATCTEAGNSAYYTCSVCGKYFSDAEGTKAIEKDSWIIDALGHKLTKTDAVAATCTEAGNNEYYTCSTCSKYFSDAEGTKSIAKDSWIIDALGHKLTKTDAVAATCTEAGNDEYYTCSACSKYFSDAEGTKSIEKDSWIIDALGHKLTKTDAKAATCTEDGAYIRTCESCGKEVVQVIPAGHTYDAGMVTKMPTLTEDGVRTFTCIHCGDSYTESIPASRENACIGPNDSEHAALTVEKSGDSEYLTNLYWRGEVRESYKDDSITYNLESNTLTLNNVNDPDLEIDASEMGVDFKICVIGENHIKSIAVWAADYPIGYNGSLSIVGNGTLCVNENRTCYDEALALHARYTASTLFVSKDVTLHVYASEGHDAILVDASTIEDAITMEARDTAIDSYATEVSAPKEIRGIFVQTNNFYKVNGSENYATAVWDENRNTNVWCVFNIYDTNIEGDNVTIASMFKDEFSNPQEVDFSQIDLGNQVEACQLLYDEERPLYTHVTDGGMFTVEYSTDGSAEYYNVYKLIDLDGEGLVFYPYAMHLAKEPTEYLRDNYNLCANTYYITDNAGHSYDEGVVTAPTCTEPGYTTHTCSDCGDSYVDSYTEALGHKWDDGKITKNATCTVDGVKTYTCTVCPATKTETVKAAGHKYTAKVTAPTCTAKGYTTHTCACGDSYVDSYTEALDHKWDDGKITKNATCTVDGVKTYTCTVCNHSYKDTYKDAKGHTTKATTTKATLSANGKIVYKCSVCGTSTKSTKTIYMPKTFSLSYTKTTYNGKVKAPTVTVKDSKGNVLKKGTDYTVTYAPGRKAVGTYKVTIRGIGNYSFTKVLTFKINPAATKIVSATNVATKSIKVKWSKAAGAGGYQVKYVKGSTTKTVKVSGASTLSKTLTKLTKGSTYKVSVRSYKTVGGTTYYSTYSAVKSVKVAK